MKMTKNQEVSTKSTDVTDDQEPRVIITNTNATDANTDADMSLNDAAILKHIIF